MKQEEQSTQDKILSSAKQEFLEKGFLNASLRNIVKNAGVTTGAFYGYYDSKEALFAALVEEQAAYILALFNRTIDDFEKLPGETQTERMVDTSEECLAKMLDYIYEHYDAFKLLVGCAQGTPYENFSHQLAVREEDSTYTYIETLAGMGHPVEKIHKNLIHIISSSLFAGIFEVVVHDMPKEEAKEYLEQFHRFHAAGWSELMGIRFGA